MISINGDQTGLATDNGEIDEGAVVVHAELDFFQTFGQDPVELAWKNGSVS